MTTEDRKDNVPTGTAAQAQASSSAGSAGANGQPAKKRRKRKVQVQDSPKQVKSPKKVAADARKVKQEYVASPPWIPYVGTGFIVLGILLIVLNYLVSGLPPLYNNWMFVGFGGMVIGLLVLSRWK